MTNQEALLVIAQALEDYISKVRLDDFEQKEILEAWTTIVNNLDDDNI